MHKKEHKVTFRLNSEDSERLNNTIPWGSKQNMLELMLRVLLNEIEHRGLLAVKKDLARASTMSSVSYHYGLSKEAREEHK